MAHSLTQQPAASLPFTSGVRTNPLGFSFGVSSFSPHASPSLPQSPSVGGFPFPRPVQASPVGFGLNHAQTQTPLGRPSPIAGPGPSSVPRPPLQSYTSSPIKKKRSRQSSLSSASSSPASAWATLPSPKLSNKGLDVGGLALEDDGRRKMVKRNMKRIRQEGSISNTSENVDLGILLATLPPTAHLPILLHLIKQNPSLESTVLSQIPQPDLSECIAALDKSMSKCRKALGVGIKVDVDPQRRWSRASPEVEELVKMATTYLSFFLSSSKSPSDPHTTHQLLQTITTDILFLLAFVPPNTSTEITPIKQLLDLAKSILEKWTSWVTDLSREINQNGSMFPHSLASQWANGMDAMITYKADKVVSPMPMSNTTWSAFGAGPPQRPEEDNHLVSSFRQALAPVRLKFYTEVGWVIGRSIVMNQ